MTQNRSPVALESTTLALLAPGKGILAADERLEESSLFGRVSSLEPGREFRKRLVTTRGIEKFLSGVLLPGEMLRNKTADGKDLIEVLRQKAVIPGIKADRGTALLPNSPGETMTKGRDVLRENLQHYLNEGARFTTWRARFTLGNGRPSSACLYLNAHDLAIFAALSQEAGLVPVLEAEVLMDGDHGIDQSASALLRMLSVLFDALRHHRVFLNALLLTMSMITAGTASAKQASVKEVALRTLAVLKETIPPAVPGILFLPGRQTCPTATEQLNFMNMCGPHPWELAFFLVPSLHDAVKAGTDQPLRDSEIQYRLYHRLKCSSSARYGTYSKEMERLAA